MRIVTTGPPFDVTDWGSTGVLVETVTEDADGRVSLARVAAGGGLGPHPAGIWQLFAVIEGAGWVSGGDGVRRPLSAGSAAVWEAGEMHESGTDGGMTVVIVQSVRDRTGGI